jgi:hypothetical protein
LDLTSTQNYTIFNIIINLVDYKYPDEPLRNKLIIRKPRVIYRYNILLLGFVHGITDIQTFRALRFGSRLCFRFQASST